MNRKNFSDCFDLLALAAVLFVVAIGCGPKYRDDLDRRDHDFSAISPEKSQPERRSDKQNQNLKPMPKPMKQRTR